MKKDNSDPGESLSARSLQLLTFVFPVFQWHFYCSSISSLLFVSKEKSLLLTSLKGFIDKGNIKDRLKRGKETII